MKITITFKLSPDLPTEKDTFTKRYTDYREMMEKVQVNNGFAGNPGDTVDLRWVIARQTPIGIGYDDTTNRPK